MEFVEAPAFTRHIHEYLDDDAYRALQAQLVASPELAPVMPGSGGFRKASLTPDSCFSRRTR
jgi:hypothetical protein